MDTKKKLRKRKTTRTRIKSRIKPRIKPRIKQIIKPRIKTRKKLINFFYKKSKKNKKAKGKPTSEQKIDYLSRLKNKIKRMKVVKIKDNKREKRNKIKEIRNKIKEIRKKEFENELKKEFENELKKELDGAQTLSNYEIRIGERLANKFNLPMDPIVQILQNVNILNKEEQNKIKEKIQVLENIINNINNNTSIGTEFADELLSNSHENIEKLHVLLVEIKKISIKNETIKEITIKIDLMFKLLNELYDIIDDLLLDDHYAYDDLSEMSSILSSKLYSIN